MGTAAAVLPAEVPVETALSGWGSWCSAFGFRNLQEPWHCCAGRWKMAGYKKEAYVGCRFLFLLCLTGRVWGKHHFRGLWLSQASSSDAC